MFSFNFDPVPWNKWFSEWRQWEYLWSTLSNWWFRGKVKTFVSINFKCFRLTAIGSPLGLDKICRPFLNFICKILEKVFYQHWTPELSLAWLCTSFSSCYLWNICLLNFNFNIWFLASKVESLCRLLNLGYYKY